ncbi:CoxG family protein [Neobacillus terrae]|uniref:CoxG family protein n=1 Tax=Neobacillus terrae TaxID=3034837 RepID=UPI00140B8A23|nr:SRPBCC family protein [Neobacillus terrae]NHM33957.1 SRPBCC family protein [Neobacillus terrae]
MPSGKTEIIMDLSIREVWNFVKDMDSWAPLVPGYITHKKISEHLSEWVFKQDIGIIKKKVTLLITIKEWIEPEKVTFTLNGVTENITGEGYFQAESLGKNRTKMTGYLDMTAGGPIAAMMNAVLKNSVPKTGEKMTAAIAAKLGEIKAGR